jgi:hypothetical protein
MIISKEYKKRFQGVTLLDSGLTLLDSGVTLLDSGVTLLDSGTNYQFPPSLAPHFSKHSYLSS